MTRKLDGSNNDQDARKKIQDPRSKKQETRNDQAAAAFDIKHCHQSVIAIDFFLARTLTRRSEPDGGYPLGYNK
jgi:hypothetical protein